LLPNNVSETHAESGDPLILDEAETGPLIPFKLVCADLSIVRRTGGRRVPLRDSWSTIHHGEPLGLNPDDKLICINYGDDLAPILSRKTRQLMLSPLSKMIFPKDHSRQKGGGFDHEHQRWPALRDNCRERHRGFLHRSDPNQRDDQLWSAANLTVC
jgi:hypothetical protein